MTAVGSVRTMTARYLDPTRLSPTELGAWRELAASAAQPNPSAEPALVLPAARHLDPDGSVRLLVVEDGPQWLACVPVRASWRWREVPRRSLLAWDHLYCTSTTPLLAGKVADQAAEGLLDHLAAQPGPDGRPVRIFGLDHLLEGPAASALLAAARRRGLAVLEADRFERAAVRRRPCADDYLAGLGSSRRGGLRRRRRRLAERLGGEAALVDRSGDAAAVEQFLALEASGWKGRAGTALAADAAHADFFREMCAGFRAEGRLHLWSLQTADAPPVAMVCGVQAGDVLSALKIAYDEDFSSLAPGVAAEVDSLRAFHERPELSMLDSCTDPGNQLLNELYPDRIGVMSVAIGLGRVLDRVLLDAFPAGRALRRRIPIR